MTEQNIEPVAIEVEDDTPSKPTPSNDEPKQEPVKPTPAKPIIPRKKIPDLTEVERQQLITEAQQGIDNPYYEVRFFKNGSSRIVHRKQSTAQRVIQEANDNQPAPPDYKRYYTDNQLLMEHVINLETSFNKLRSKHKALKKRYNELEGYLYNDDDEPKPQQQPKQVPAQTPVQAQPVREEVNEEPVQQQHIQQPIPQRRYVRSWRDINRQ
mgnify:CR=1 FL=1